MALKKRTIHRILLNSHFLLFDIRLDVAFVG